MSQKDPRNLDQTASDGTRITLEFPLDCEGKIVQHIEWSERIARRQSVRVLMFDNWHEIAFSYPESVDYVDPTTKLVEITAESRPGLKNIYYM